MHTVAIPGVSFMQTHGMKKVYNEATGPCIRNVIDDQQLRFDNPCILF